MQGMAAEAAAKAFDRTCTVMSNSTSSDIKFQKAARDARHLAQPSL
jgi:hypothetical protein